MPRPDPPAYVKMPGRPKTERRREIGEKPKGTKLSRVGIKMTCRLCKRDDHNARKCPKNPKAGKKAKAHIKREKAKKRKAQEGAGSSKKKGKTCNKQVTITLSVNLTYYYNLTQTLSLDGWSKPA